MWRVVVVVALPGFVLSSCSDDTRPGSAKATTTTQAESTTTSAAATTATAHPVTLRCDTVVFTPDSEDGAFDVTATGLPCDDAEAFVRVAGRRTSSGGPPQLEVAGYRCVRTRSEEDPLPQAFYTCTSGPKKVTFVRG